MDPFSFAVMTVAQIGIGLLFPSSGPRLKDLKIAASTYGAVIPEAYGTVRVAANMIWSDKIREHKKKKTVGLKSYKYYTYTCSFAMGVCRGPVSSVRRIWANHKLIYDASGGPIAIKKRFKIKPYYGDEDQEPAGLIEDLMGAGNVPAYRGLCYIMFEDMPLEDFGNSIPQISVEVFASGEADEIGLYTRFTPLSGQTRPTPEMVYSSEHDIGVLRDTGNPGGLRRVRISTMTEEFAVNEIDLGLDLSYLMGISPSTGNIITQADFGNSNPIVMLEPNGLTEILRMGAYSSDLQILPSASKPGTFSIDGDRQEYLAYDSILGYWRILQTYPLPMFSLGNTAAVGQQMYGVYGRSYIVGTRGLAQATFYIWDGANAAGGYVPYLRLWKIVYRAADTYTKEIVFQYDNPTPEDPNAIDFGFEVRGVHWDAADHGVLVLWSETRNSQVQMGKIDVASGEMRWRIPMAAYDGPGASQMQPGVIDGEFWWLYSSGITHRLMRIDSVTGEWIRETRDPWTDYENTDDIPASVISPPSAGYQGSKLVSTSGGSTTFPGSDKWYDPAIRAIIGAGNFFGTGIPAYIVRPGLGPQKGVTLAGLVERVLRRAGMSSGQFDLTDLEQQPILGYGWASASDVKSIIDQLRMIYLFDLFERDGKLVGLMRQSSSNETNPGKPVRRLTQKLLGSNGDGSGMDYWKETRIQEADLPQRVTLSYMNWDNDFETSTAISRRIIDPVPAMFSRQQVAMEMGVVMTATEAKNQVNKVLWSQWGERAKHNTRLPWAYLDLDPADVITVTMNDGRVYRDRLHTLEFGADLGIDSESYAQDEAAYISDAVADGGGSGPPILTSPARPARPLIFNTPLLRDQDDTGGSFSLYYTGIGHGAPDDFPGAGLWRSTSGQAFDLLYTTNQDVEWGQVTGVVPPPRHGAFGLDWETRINIWPVINWFEIESITDDELWAGGNLCVIGAEVMQFRDCVQNVDGSWTIWNLLRGRRGTEYACATHKTGETFSFLATTTIEAEGETLDANGQARWFIGLGEGKLLEEAPATKLIYAPRDLMPYAPKDIRRTLNGETVTLDWKRRTRMGGNMQDGTETVPLNETDERYEVYILSAPYSGDMSRGDEVPVDLILYQAVTTASTLTFDVAAFTAPIDVNLDTLHVLIYQVSSAVGRGFPGVRSIEPWQDF